MNTQYTSMTPNETIPVALAKCGTYDRAHVEDSVRQCLIASGILPSGEGHSVLSYGDCVLVKPNLLRASALSCTHPEVVRAACVCLQEHGVKVRVADSPGFGSAVGVADTIGLTEALRPLGLKVQGFAKAKSLPLGPMAGKGRWGVAQLALESDYILSVPRAKAHCQMRVTMSVKNLFGCVCGLRKAVAHWKQGHSVEMFSSGILDLWKSLPLSMALVDGGTAMHVTGPSGGEPFALGCIGASRSAIALDTALYTLLKVLPVQVPLWEMAQKRQLEGSFFEQLSFPLAKPSDFSATGFIIPELIHISFQPRRLLWSLFRRVWSRVTN